jgi:L-asparaginase
MTRSRPRERRRLASVHVALGCHRATLPSNAAANADDPALPRVLVIGTGGTIAGEQKKDEQGTLGGYRAGALAVGSLVSGLPQAELSKHASVDSEQFLNVASPAITPAHWLSLSRRINELFSGASPPDGVVVTHGTDRLEETAFWLYLTVASDRPVAIVGAQRPATGLSPDGPVNLLSAIRVAASPHSVGMGAVVVMDDRIMSARECRKLYPRVGGFGVGEGMGTLGVVNSDGPSYFFAPVRRHGAATDFAPDPQQEEDAEATTAVEEGAAEESTLPRVELVFSYPGGDGPTLRDDTAGVVVVTTSGFAPGEREAFDAIRRRGVVMVTCFPSGDHVSPAFREWRRPPDKTEKEEKEEGGEEKEKEVPLPPMIRASHLLPAKARILLMCALTKTRDPVKVQEYFSQY